MQNVKKKHQRHKNEKQTFYFLNNNKEKKQSTKRSVTMKQVSSYQWKQNSNEITTKL
jgi:hypothetical protein